MNTHEANRLTKMVSGVTAAVGSFPAILFSVGIVVLWGVSGPFFKFSDTWQLLINTPTTIITFWMAFVIQNTQNRDGRAIQTKLDAILHNMEEISDDLIGIEELPEKEIKEKQDRVRDQAEA